jgi:HEAT repeat protein
MKAIIWILIPSFACLVSFANLRATGDEVATPMELAGRLRDADPEIRLEAVRALKQLGPQAKTAVLGLSDALEDKEPLIRIEAARALGAIGPDAKAAIPALVKRLDDKDAVRSEGAVWFAAAKALGEIGPASMPHLMPILEAEDWTRFIPVAEALYRIGPEARQAVPHLLSALKHKSDVEHIRNASIYALGGIGAATEEVVSRLIALVRHDSFHTQYFACRALGEIGPKAAAATPALIKAATTGVSSVRRHAARALGRIHPVDDSVVALLVSMLDDKSYSVRVEAALALGKFGSTAKSALPDLMRTAQDKKRRIQVEAARSIWKLTGDAEKILPVLINELENFDNSISAAQLLGEMGVAATQAISALQKTTQSEDPETSQAAVDALEKIQPDGGTLTGPPDPQPQGR